MAIIFGSKEAVKILEISKRLRQDFGFLQKAKLVTCKHCYGSGQVETGDEDGAWDEICDECLGQGEVYSDDKQTMSIPAAERVEKKAREAGWLR